MNIAILLSGGSGKRFGSEIPKQYIMLGNRPVIAYSLDSLLNHKDIDGVIIVADSNWFDLINEIININIYKEKFMGYVLPGDIRQMSIYNALKYIENNKQDTDIVFIHDAARPYLKSEMISVYFDEFTKDYDGVMPVLPMKDTVYYSDDGEGITSLLNRDKVFRGQAPELFRFKKYLEANEKLMPDKILEINGSSEPAVMDRLRIKMVEGNENNIKITTKNDLEKIKLCMQ